MQGGSTRDWCGMTECSSRGDRLKMQEKERQLKEESCQKGERR